MNTNLLNFWFKFIAATCYPLIELATFSYAVAQPQQTLVARATIAEADWSPLFGEMQINGRNVLVEVTQSPLKPSQLHASLKREWEQKGFRVQEAVSGDWQIISRILGTQVELVQIRAGSMGSELLRHRASLNDGHSPMPKPEWLGSAGRVVFVSNSKSSIERGTSWLLELPHGDSIDVLVSQLTREGFQEQAVAQRISSYQMQRLGLFNQGGFRTTPSAPRVLTKVGQYQLSLQHFFDRGRSLVLVNEIQPFAKQQTTR